MVSRTVAYLKMTLASSGRDWKNTQTCKKTW